MSNIFVSYSRKDEEFAKKVATSLINAGYDVWMDVKDISSGVKWSSAIQEGLDICELLIVIISPESMASVNVEDEWQYFLDQQKPVIPILWKQTKVHFQLNRIQYIDFEKNDLFAAISKLDQEIKVKGFASQNTPSSSRPIVEIHNLLPSPFEWCEITAGTVLVLDTQ